MVPLLMRMGEQTDSIDLEDKLVPTLVTTLHQLGVRVGRCLPLQIHHALAFDKDMHLRLGAEGGGAGAGGRMMSQRLEGKEPDEGRGFA